MASTRVTTLRRDPTGRLVYNYTGGSLGFPILKNKLFLFGDFLRTSDHESSTVLTNIPYYNVVNGNIDLGGAGYAKGGQVYDPNTGVTASCNTNVASTPVCGTGRTPFLNNQIPLSNPGISPIGLKVLQLLDAQARNPALNLAYNTYTSGSLTNNFSQNVPFSKDSTSYDIKSDYTISAKDHLSGRFSHQTTNTFQAPLFGSFLGGPIGGGFQATGVAATYSTGLNYTHLFSSSLILDARAGVAHSRNTAQQSDYGANDAKTLGIPGNGPNGTNNVITSSGQVAFQVANFVGNGSGTGNPLIGYSQSLPWLRAESNIDFSAIVTKVLGNHTLKLGADVRRIRDDLLQGNNNAAAGTFYFSENQTSAPGAVPLNGATTGQSNDVASILFGVPNQVGQDTNSTFPAYRQTWEFFFVSDKWQATSKLTLDLGLRYELYPPATPRRAGGFVSYNPATNSLIQAGVAGNPSNIGQQTDYRNFAPRLGASYRVTDKTVVRAGFGVSYVPFVDNTYAYNYPIKTSTAYTNSPTYGSALNPAGGVVNFVTGIPATPTIAFGGDGTLTETAANGTLGLANLYIPLNFKNAYVSSWNAVVQQVMPFDSTLQVAYVANHGTRIDVSQNINLPTVYGQGAAYDPLNHAADGVTTTFGKTAPVTQFFLGYSTNYQSLQVEFKHRFQRGLAFGSTFTFSKAENYQTGAQDGALLFYAGPVHRNYAVTDFDRTRNFSQTLTYELPAGPGHRHFASGLAGYALGGWKVSAIISAVSGLPFTTTGTSLTSGTTQTGNLNGTYSVSHNHVGTVSTGSPTWFNTAPFSQVPGNCAYTPASPVACPLGNTGRNQFRGPGYFSDNASAFKNVPLYKERVNLELRLDAFNLSNTPAFGLPGTTVGSSNFGKITSTLGSGVGNVNGVGGPRVLQAAAKFTF